MTGTPSFGLGGTPRGAEFAAMREMRRELLQRFRDERATAADHVIAIDTDAMEDDERRLFEGFVERGVIGTFRGGYYLDEEALAKEDRPGNAGVIVGAVIILAMMSWVIWNALP